MTVTRETFIRPSSLEAIAACPGRPTMEAAVVNAFGEAPEAPEAGLGTRAHQAVALTIKHWCLCQETGERGADWADAIELAKEHCATLGLDSWTTTVVERCIGIARDLIARHDIDPDDVLVEHELDMASLGFARGGTADMVLVDRGKLVVVVDWKCGFLDQGDADVHDQTQAYAAAAAETFTAPEVIVYLVQARMEADRRVSAARYDAAALRGNRAWTAAVIRRARADNPELTPGYAACVHCRALSRCAAAKEWIVNANEALAMIGLPDDADAWGALASVSQVAGKFHEQAKDQVKGHLIAGGDATGWGLADGRSIRSCSDPREALTRLEGAGMAAEARGALSLSPARLPEAGVALIADLVQTKPSAPSLKPVKASRA